MKKFILMLFVFIFTSAISFSQPPENRDNKAKREKIQAQKIAFISTQLALTPEEAQKFWPIYNRYEAEIDAVRQERKGYMRELRKDEGLSADRGYELTQKIFETEKKESDIRLNYLKEFSTVLGKKKATMVFIAEEKFKRELLEQLKKEGRTPPPPGEDRGH